MKANELMKRNIDALLQARQLKRKDLAEWCRKGESWISKIMKEDRREFPMKYWDRIADFFGIAPYQLLQPGMSFVTERRKAERRSGKDRRLSAMNQRVRQSLSEAIASLSPADVADMIRFKTFAEEDRAVVRETMLELERSKQQALRRAGKPPSAGKASAGATSRVKHSQKGHGATHRDGTEG